MNHANHDRREEQQYARLATQNQQTTVAGYVSSLSRPTTGEYTVLPNGVVEFHRIA